MTDATHTLCRLEQSASEGMNMTKPLMTALCLLLGASALSAAQLDAPPSYAGDVAPAATAPAKKVPAADESANPLLPSKADMEKAREDRAKGHVPPKYERQTQIDAVRDENNRVTEYVVTPGSTHIPYKIENQADKPIDSTPGSNSKSTLGTTKFIEFGW